jgi:hypothetical protein
MGEWIWGLTGHLHIGKVGGGAGRVDGPALEDANILGLHLADHQIIFVGDEEFGVRNDSCACKKCIGEWSFLFGNSPLKNQVTSGLGLPSVEQLRLKVLPSAANNSRGSTLACGACITVSHTVASPWPPEVRARQV